MENIIEFDYVDSSTGLLEKGYEVKGTGLRFFDYLSLLNFLRG